MKLRFDMRKVIRQEIDIPWNAHTVKEYLWRPVQMTQLGKESTKDLNTGEIDKIYETLNRHLNERTGVHIAFPSNEPNFLDTDYQEYAMA